MSYDASVLALSPTYFWETNEASGTTAADSADSNPGTYNNCSLAKVGPGSLGNAAITFNGTSSYIETTNSVTAPQNTFSLAFWFKTTVASSGIISITQAQTPVGSGSYTYTGIAVYVDSSGLLNFGITTTTPSRISIASSAAVNDGNWHHCVITMSAGGAMTLYIDGSIAASNTNTLSVYLDTYTFWNAGWMSDYGFPNIGSGAGGSIYFTGSLATLAIWMSTVLTSSQVSALCAAGGSVSPLSGAFFF